MTDRLNVAFVPVYSNPYQHLLSTALSYQGVNVTHLKAMPTLAWLFQQRNTIQIIHLHWLSGLYMRRLLTPLQLVSFLGKLLLAQCLGYRIVWTVHNILPHKLPYPPMHHFVRRFVMRHADEVIAHCEFGQQEITRLFPRKKAVHIVAIGSYSNVYPFRVSREKARQHLNIPDLSFVYLFLGNIETYKGIETFAEIFHQSADANDIALIAGRDRAPALVTHLKVAASKDARFRIHAGFIPDDEIQLFIRSADVMVLPFKEILTSSSIITGMSYGLPIIAPALGCLPELITPQAGILYDARDPDGLHQAMLQIKRVNTAQMGRAAKAISDNLSWETIARQTAQIYRQCVLNNQ